MRIPVVILNWNGWDDTLACLRCLRACGDVEDVWLVDNGSRLDRGREAAELLPSLRILRLARNYGWAGGNNRALRLVARQGHEFAYLLNNDCLPSGRFLAPAAREALKDRRLSAVGSQILYPDGSVYFDGGYHQPGRRRPAPRSGASYRVHVDGAGMLVRLQALSQCGYFDERFFCYQEEAEWCQRSARLGWRCLVAPKSRVLHQQRQSDVNDNALYYLIRNSLLLARLGCRIPACRDTREFIHAAIMRGEWARRTGRTSAWAAVTDGLQDGLRERFGKRPSPPRGRADPGRTWNALVRRLLRRGIP